MCIGKRKKKSCDVRSESLVFHCFSALASVLSVYFSVHWDLLSVLFFALFYFLIYLKHLSISVPKVPALFLMALLCFYAMILQSFQACFLDYF